MEKLREDLKAPTRQPSRGHLNKATAASSFPARTINASVLAAPLPHRLGQSVADGDTGEALDARVEDAQHAGSLL
jgi:hypothetical protein